MAGFDPSTEAYVTLDEALVSGTVRVSEVSDGGSVPELLFGNLGKRPVLLVDGEELVGAKQSRTLNNDLRFRTLYGCTRCPTRSEIHTRWNSRTLIR